MIVLLVKIKKYISISYSFYKVPMRYYLFSFLLTGGGGNFDRKLSFSYDNVNVEIVKNFNYLGIIFTRTGNFNLTKKPSS
jgi:hypothetical protein